VLEIHIIMITDARVLRTEFVPQDVVHRDAEVDALTAVLDPLAEGEPADPAVMHGPSGVGKTCIANYTLEQLRQAVLDIDVQYVNCWQNYSGYRVLYRLLEGLGKTVDIHRRSTPMDELLERLRNYDGPPCVIVLDEVDQLEQKQLLYHLRELSQFATVLIANDTRSIFDTADDRVASRYTGAERIEFSRYSMSELVSILDARATWGLEPGAVSERALERIADLAAGDARAAISILRSAARHAETDGLGSISVALVDDAEPAARQEVQRKNLDTLTPHQRALYDCIQENGEMEPADVYRGYRERVDDPRSDRTVRNHLQKLARYNLIRIEGTSRDRVYAPIE
jgi:orc1/cdc6 family replication initiation protein